MYIQRNVVAGSRSQFGHGKSVLNVMSARVYGLTYPECNAHAPYDTVI